MSERILDVFNLGPRTAARKQPKSAREAESPQGEATEPGGSTARRVTDATLLALPGLVGYTPSAGFAEQVAELQGKFEAALNRVNGLGVDHVRRLQAEQTQAGIDAVMAGNPTAAGLGGAYHSREQLREQLRAEKGALKAGLRQLIGQAADQIRAEAAKFTQAATRYADDMEGREKDICEALSIRYEPSATVRTIRAAIATVADRIPTADRLLYQSPRSMVSWFTL